MLIRKSQALLLTILGVTGLTACAVERPTINRVQPNALEKAFFVGQLDTHADDPVFLSRNFVVDASESQDLVGISSASGVERIRFEITEDTLFARRAYSITGGTPRGSREKPDGDVVAAYRIEQHFDIRNAYNPATGEELNIAEENVDRAWQDREFFRVDWSQNLIDSPQWTTMFYGKMFGDIKVSPIAYYDSDESSDDAPLFSQKDGYFDVTSHFLIEPEMTQWGRFSLPLCMMMGMFTGSAIYSCDPQEAVVRTSFWRLDQADPDDDFEPYENTEAPQEIFGNPGGIGESASHGIVPAPFEGYDPQYGYTDEGVKRLMLRHNIWAQSHQTVGACETNADCRAVTGRSGAVCLASGACTVPCDYKTRGDSDGNGTDDQCENADTGYAGELGAQCSLRNRCTIPVRDRELKKLTYYTDPEMPEALQDTVNKSGKVTRQGANEQMIATWNQALQQAVGAAREVECRRTAGASDREATRDECHARYFRVNEDGSDKIQMVSLGGWGMPTPRNVGDVLVMCHNPVRDYDDDACGEPGERFRQGDIRKNMLIYWNYATQAPYGGIGAWRGDPATGQIVGAAATTIGRSATVSAGKVRDLILVALGKLGFNEITNGTSAELFQRTLQDGRVPETFTRQQLSDRLAAIDLDKLATSVPVNLSGIDPNDPAPGLAKLRSSLGRSPGQEAKYQLAFDAAVKPLLDTRFEAQMVKGGWLLDSVGANPNATLTEDLLSVASPLRAYDLGKLAAGDQDLLRAMGERGICHLDGLTSIGSPDIAGLGRYYQAKYAGSSDQEFADKVYEDLWANIYQGIQLHEIGHSLGLLHNFTSSWDAVNYDPQYWQLRTHEGQSTASCNGTPRGTSTSPLDDTCMGPRYLDPDTEDELGIAAEPRPGLNYYAHTSTMEYQNARFFETIGLGQYDVMSMKALYGRVLETMDSRVIPVVEQANFFSLNETQRSDDARVYNPDVNFPLGLHYTELARRMRLFDPSRCREATPEEKAKAEWRIVHNKVCAPQTKDHAHWDDFLDASDFPTRTVGSKLLVDPRHNTSAAGSGRWPYRFGGDQQNSYMHVNPFDSGADAYEVTMETIRKNNYNYPLTYFRAKRRGWTDLQLPSFMARNFYERLRSYHWGIAFQNAIYKQLEDAIPQLAGLFDDWRKSDDIMRPGLVAQVEMFNGIAAVLMAPEPGTYEQLEFNGSFYDTDRPDASGSASFVVDASIGRFLAPDYDDGPNAGGSWDYLNYANRSGFEVEKALAARALTDGRPVFHSFSRDIFLDDRIININFRNDMATAVDRLLGGLLSEDWATVSPFLNSPDVANGTATLQVPDLLLPTPTLPSTALQVFPNFGYNQAVPTMVYAHLYGRMNGDLDLSNKMRVWLDGSISSEIELPESEQVRFTYPESGITYIARRYGTQTVLGVQADGGIGSRMLATANRLLTEIYEVARDDRGNPVLDAVGRPQLVRDGNGSLVLRSGLDIEKKRVKLLKYVGQLDATVQIGDYVGYGPFNL